MTLAISLQNSIFVTFPWFLRVAELQTGSFGLILASIKALAARRGKLLEAGAPAPREDVSHQDQFVALSED